MGKLNPAAGVAPGTASSEPLYRTEPEPAREPLAALRRLSRIVVHGERNQCAPTLRSRESHTLRERRHQQLRCARCHGGGQSGACRHESCGALQAHCGRGRDGRSPVAPSRLRIQRQERLFQFRQDICATPARSRRVLRDGHSRRPFSGCAERHAPGFCGHVVVQAVLSLRNQRLAARRSGQSSPAPGACQGPQSRVDSLI